MKRIGIFCPIGSSSPFRVANKLCQLSTTHPSKYHFVKLNRENISSAQLSNIDLFHLTVSPWIAPIPYLKWLSMCKRARIPTITNIHGDYVLEFLFALSDGHFTEAIREAPTILLSRYVLDLSDNLVVNSKQMADRLINIYGISRKKIWVIANGIEPPDEGPHENERLNKNKNNKMVIFTHGVLSSRKGLFDVMDAIKKLDRDDISLQIAGKGPLAPRLSRYIKRLDLSEKVELLGYLTENQLIERLRLSDICIYPTKFDGFNIAVLEAMRRTEGVVLTSRGAGVTDFFPSELSESMFRPTTSDITSAIETCLRLSPDERLKLRQAQQAFAKEMTWLNIWDNYIQMYDSVMHPTGRHYPNSISE